MPGAMWQLVLFGWLVAVLGCSSTDPPQWTAVTDGFASADTTGRLRCDVSGVPERPAIRLYVDRSKSMKGFVADDGSAYNRTLSHLIDKATTAQYPLAAYSFSELFVPLDKMIVAALADTEFYDGRDTPLAQVLNRIADTKQPCIHVLISDFVQSDVFEDRIVLVKAFQRILAKRPQVVFLAGRSSFHGEYYIEASSETPRGHFRLDLTGNGVQGRPYYVLVLAPSSSVLEQFRRFVLDTAPYAESFEPTRKPVTIGSAGYSGTCGGQPLHWERLGPLDLTESPAGNSEFKAAFRHTGRFRDGELPLQVAFSVDVAQPFMSLDRLDVRVMRTRFGKSGQPANLDPINVCPRIIASQDGLSWTLSYPFLPPEKKLWDAYHIEFSAGAGNLKMPVWVPEWSTSDDRPRASGNRTLFLDLFVESMVRGITETIVFSDQYLVLGQR